MPTKEMPTLYKIDTKGKTRVWWIEYDEERYRTHSGIMDGKLVSSGWQRPTEKNVGRSNATTVAEQVFAEVKAEYEKKQNQGKYHGNLSDADGGAKFIECMLASKFDPKKHKQYPYFSQPKLDGIRCIVSKAGMQSRQGKPITSCPHIMEALAPFFSAHPDAVLDGELYNHDLRDHFEKIVSLVRKTKPTTIDYIEASKLVQYHVYDCVMDAPFVDRLSFINKNFGTFSSFGDRYFPIVRAVRTWTVDDEHDVETMLGHFLETGYEGQMLRVMDSPYEGKRSKNLMKHKEFQDEEFKIVSIEEGKGNWEGYAKSVEIQLNDGTTQSSGVRGNQEFMYEILKNKDKLIGTEVTVRYQNKTADGKLRFPVVVAFWEGKRDL